MITPYEGTWTGTTLVIGPKGAAGVTDTPFGLARGGRDILRIVATYLKNSSLSANACRAHLTKDGSLSLGPGNGAELQSGEPLNYDPVYTNRGGLLVPQYYAGDTWRIEGSGAVTVTVVFLVEE